MQGSWIVRELLFSEKGTRAFVVEGSDDDCEERHGQTRDWDGEDAGGGGGGGGSGVFESGLFDLVVAADIVYLQNLWDAMAFTIKVRFVVSMLYFFAPLSVGVYMFVRLPHGSRRFVTLCTKKSYIYIYV